jgi:small subunit ribosomal protein S1
MEQNDAQLEQGAMPEKDNNENNMAALLEKEGLDIDFPRQGEIRDGVIASITPGQILVSVGTKSEGVISGREYDLIPEDELKSLKIGQEVPVFVVNPSDQNDTLVLSYVRAREEVSWRNAEEMLNSKDSFDSKIIGYNKGGLIVPLEGLRGFVPASQVSLSRRATVTGDTPEERWSEMVGQEIEVCVIEVDRDRRRLILSERAATHETRESLKERVIEELEEGEVRTGRVTSLADFGAFVNIAGADGLVHLSEISWDRINHPSEVLEVGQEVRVKVISIDKDKKRIGLSIRQLQSDPWVSKAEQYQQGQLVEGTITRLTKFGAFARLEEDLEGLIHISEISERRIEHPKEVLNEGDVVTLRVIRVDPENHRIGLSLRRVESMAYADMDWQTLLDEENQSQEDQSQADEPEVEEPVQELAVEVEEETQETTEEVTAELTEAEAEETPEVETPDAAEEEAPETAEEEPKEPPAEK